MISGRINRGPGPWIEYDWSEFKKYLDGTYYYLSYRYQDKESHYYIITERGGGFGYECTIAKTNNADQIDFENNFKNLPPRFTDEKSEMNLFDIQDDVIYLGIAKIGSLPASAVWTIKKITLVDGTPSKRESTKVESGVWDDRSSETYY